jgi:hypothetical protein
MDLNILNKVYTLENLIKEIRDSLNSQKVRKENKNWIKEKNMRDLLLKQKKQNQWYDEFLKLKKNYNEEYLKEKEFEDDKRKYENVYMKIPYRWINELNVDDYINKNLTVIQKIKKVEQNQNINLHQKKVTKVQEIKTKNKLMTVL